MKQPAQIETRNAAKPPLGGLAGWLLERLHRGPRTRPRLALLERINLAPRQSLALVEAEGRHLLVATSADGAAAFYALDRQGTTGEAVDSSRPARSLRRIS